MLEFSFDALVVNQPYLEKLVEVVERLFVFGLISFFGLEIYKRIESLFVKEGQTNFRVVHKERPFFKREFGNELCWVFFGTVVMLPLLGLKQLLLVEWVLKPNFTYQPLGPLIDTWPTWLQVCFGVLLIDFATYLRHRFTHHFLWPYHVIHHSTREITWLTFWKGHPLDTLVMGAIQTILLYFLGFPGVAIVIAMNLNFHYNRFVHSNIELDYGFPLRYIFVSPNMHRWHHAADDPKAYNTNFAIVFAFFDLAFGSFYLPKNRLPGSYGVCDEEGNHVVGEGFIEQLMYPFVHHKRWILAKLGKREAVPAPPERFSKDHDAGS